jgi:hypothetical protein
LIKTTKSSIVIEDINYLLYLLNHVKKSIEVDVRIEYLVHIFDYDNDSITFYSLHKNPTKGLNKFLQAFNVAKKMPHGSWARNEAPKKRAMGVFLEELLGKVTFDKCQCQHKHVTTKKKTSERVIGKYVDNQEKRKDKYGG